MDVSKKTSAKVKLLDRSDPTGLSKRRAQSGAAKSGVIKVNKR